ncbi:hypothetical protein ACQJBY_007072 [Aegilops geniculata]
MDSWRRAKLLATLSPEGLATYEVLKAQLAHDLDRSFAASKARREKSVEMAFADLHTKLDRTIDDLRWKVRGDDGRRSAPATAASASSTTRSAMFPLVPHGSGATVVDISTPATVSAPSAHTATSTCVPIVAALDSTSPRVQAVTATAPMASAASVDLNLKGGIDHLIGGSTRTTSNHSDVITMFSASTVLVSDLGAVNTIATSTPAPPHAYCSTGGLSHHAGGEDPVVMPLPPEGAPTSIISPLEHSPSPPLEQSDIIKLVTVNPLLQPTTCSTEWPGGDTNAARTILSPTVVPGMCSTEGVDEDTSVKSP